MNTHDRWQRLADQITEGGVEVKPASRAYPGGISHFISQRLDNGLIVEVRDRWWRKNDQVWIGYEVYTETAADGITRRAWPLTKKRSEVVAAVVEAAQLSA